MTLMRTISIQPTQQCNAACENCGTFSSPATKTRLEESQMEKVIREAAAAGCEESVFSGGEPTLAGRSLLRLMRLAAAHKMSVRLITNGWWAKTEESAGRWASLFVDAGAYEIAFSTGDQHARFVPLESIVTGVKASLQQGLRVTVFIELIEPRKITRSSFEALPKIRELHLAYGANKFNIIQSPWMPVDAGEVRTYPPGVAVNRDNLNKRGGCDDILKTITISPDGTISACCGIGMRRIPELQLGNIRNTSLLAAYQAADQDSLMRRIRLEGPEHLLAWASARDPSIQWENMYAHRCQACIRLFTDSRVIEALRRSARPSGVVATQ